MVNLAVVVCLLLTVLMVIHFTNRLLKMLPSLRGLLSTNKINERFNTFCNTCVHSKADIMNQKVHTYRVAGVVPAPAIHIQRLMPSLRKLAILPAPLGYEHWTLLTLFFL